MSRFIPGICLACLAAIGNAQPADGLKFEVASLTPASLDGDKPITMIGFDAGPGHLNSSFTTLKMMVMFAYDLKPFQVLGLPWLETERYNLMAKVPAGATRQQVRIMLQNLLAERFKLQAHRDRKDLPVYALTVGKDELKLKATVPAPESTPAPADSAPSGGPKFGADGFPIVPASALASGPIILYRNGKARMQASGATIQQIADILTSQLDRLVVDETHLTGKYDADFIWQQDAAVLTRGAGNVAAPDAAAAAVAAEPGTQLIAAIRQELGLRVIAKKGPVDVVVVDHMEKTATEN